MQRLNHIAISRLQEHPEAQVSIRPPQPIDFTGGGHTIHWASTSRRVQWKDIQIKHMDWMLQPLHELSGLDFVIEPALGIATDPSKRIWGFNL